MRNQCRREPTLAESAIVWVFAILLGAAVVAVVEMPTWLAIWRGVQ